MYGPADGTFRNAERSRGGSVADAGGEQLTELARIGDHAWPSESLALGACSPQACMGPFDDPCAFDFGQDANEGEHRASDR